MTEAAEVKALIDALPMAWVDGCLRGDCPSCHVQGCLALEVYSPTEFNLICSSKAKCSYDDIAQAVRGQGNGKAAGIKQAPAEPLAWEVKYPPTAIRVSSKPSNSWQAPPEVEQEELITPEIKTGTEVDAMDLPPVEWIIKDYIPKGLVILAGAEKTGKSFLALNVGLAIAAGMPILGDENVRAGDVLYLAMEDSYRRIQDRQRKMLQGCPPPGTIHYAVGWPSLDRGGLNAIRQWVAARDGCRMVIIDTLQTIRGATVKGEGVYEGDYRVMRTLKSIADQNDICLMVVHHTRKNLDEGDVFSNVSGSKGITGAADATMLLSRRRGQNHGKLHVTGRDLKEKADDTAAQILWDEETQWWNLNTDIGDKKEKPVQDWQERVVEKQLKMAGVPLTEPDAAALTGMEMREVEATLGEMSKSGKAEKVWRPK